VPVGGRRDEEAAAGGDASCRRFLILAVVWVAYLMVYTARLSVGPLSPFLKDAFDLSNAQIGLLISATAVTYAPSLIVAGWLVDRVGVRRMLISGTLIAAGSVLLLFFADSYASLLALLAVSSIGAGFIFPSAISAVMRWFPLRERATAIGVNQTAINVAGILGAATLPTIATDFGWQYGFLAIALMGFVVAGVCIVGYSNPPAAATTESPPDAAAPQRPSTRRLLASRDVWLLGLCGVFLGAAEYSTLAHLVLYTKVEYLFGAVTAGLLLALCQASGAVGKPLAGFVSDRLFDGLRRPTLLGMAGLVLVVCLVLALAGPRLGWGIYPAVALLGFSAIGWGGVFGTAAGEIGGPGGAGRVAGLTAAGVNVGAMIGAPLFGYAVDASGSYRPSWLLMAGCAAAAIVCLAFFREPHVARAEIVPALADA
jgi:ACS family hexuronate transporter-like MFS transporter